MAHWLAREQGAEYAIRVGGPNSGHTVMVNGCPVVLRQLPTPALGGDVTAIIPAGGYIAEDVLLGEIEEAGLAKGQLCIDPNAVVIDDSMRTEECDAGLIEAIASTAQGVGSAVARRAMRDASVGFAEDSRRLRRYVRTDLNRMLAGALSRGARVLVEGTQGFGLSVLHGRHYPYATSRDTTVTGALSEAGLGASSVDCVALVLRAFPIRVGGNSGPLPLETSWEQVTKESGGHAELVEYTTVTRRVRRVAKFDEEVVQRAIDVNEPDLMFLNHVDYFDYSLYEQPCVSESAAREVARLERRVGVRIDHIGVGPSTILRRPDLGWLARDGDRRVASAG